ncbi:glutathione S-transferase [Roseovarius sp.]|jgi:glutathione S-transferase|uniref:glutathione S-transferase n=1 Tax=Roseovarius sp. TaxID=1486281 RepID=UPI00262F7484|nr:glutathione S-transferase [Roseovarius sp.]MDM8164656.1 glutathione S-transferase [Roseovarius sp.]
MKLIAALPSPFVRKVRVLLHETGQTDAVELVEISTTPMNTDAQAAAANPVGKIPALVREDGPAIYDSRVICRYLDDRFGAGLYPQARVWETLTLEATADAMMEAAVLMVYEHRVRPPEKVFDGWIDAQWAKVARCVEAVNGRWMSHLNGPLDMSHVAIGCALGYLDFRHPDRNWREGAGALDDWYAVFSARESMKATAPE